MKIPWRRAWHPLQYPCLENPMDRGAWRAVVHRVTKSWAWLKWLSTHTLSSGSTSSPSSILVYQPSQASPHFKGGKCGFRTVFCRLQFLQRPGKWHPCPKQAKGESAGHAEKPGSVPSEGGSCSSEPRAVIPSLFSKRSWKSVFLCEISQYLNTLQAKQNTATGSDPCFITENASFCSVKLNECSIMGRNLELSVRLCSSKDGTPPFEPLRYSLTDSHRLTAGLWKWTRKRKQANYSRSLCKVREVMQTLGRLQTEVRWQPGSPPFPWTVG